LKSGQIVVQDMPRELWQERWLQSDALHEI
jgi:hypothetical protein